MGKGRNKKKRAAKKEHNNDSIKNQTEAIVNADEDDSSIVYNDDVIVSAITDVSTSSVDTSIGKIHIKDDKQLKELPQDEEDIGSTLDSWECRDIDNNKDNEDIKRFKRCTQSKRTTSDSDGQTHQHKSDYQAKGSKHSQNIKSSRHNCEKSCNAPCCRADISKPKHNDIESSSGGRHLNKSNNNDANTSRADRKKSRSRERYADKIHDEKSRTESLNSGFNQHNQNKSPRNNINTRQGDHTNKSRSRERNDNKTSDLYKDNIRTAVNNTKSSRSKSRSNDRIYMKFELWEKQYKNDGEIFKIVHEVVGDLFSADADYSLGHCVAEDMNMGSGIAVNFRQTFKQVSELLDQRKTQGEVAVLQDKQRYIYYLVTKRESSKKPTYYTLWSSLQAMKKHILSFDVKKLALPRIGCGLDSLDWSRVKKMLEYTFQDVEIEIKIYNFQQESNNAGMPPPKLRKCLVKNVPYPVSDIEYGTIIVYFGSQDGFITEEIKTISQKYPYISNNYRTESKAVGTFIRTERNNQRYIFYGCIVRNCHTDSFNFTYLQQCLNSIQMQNKKKDYYKYIAFQAFLEKGDRMTVSKIVNLMRHAMTDVDVYVCWPPKLESYMPREY